MVMRQALRLRTMRTSLRELSMSDQTASLFRAGIDHISATPPVPIPRGHVGEFVIPGTGKRVWWTGRVAIGLRYQPQRCLEPVPQSSLWIQQLMTARRPGALYTALRTRGAAA
jgi:hypothetical protein